MPRLVVRALGVLLAVLSSAPLAQPAAPGDIELKAAIALKFLHYTHWPDMDSAATVDRPRTLVVVGNRADRSVLLKLARESERLGQPKVIVRWANPATTSIDEMVELARKSHALFISSSSLGDASDVLTALTGFPVLTIGDSPEFTRRGGMLGLVKHGNRLRFDANTLSIRAAGLQVSARVLRLARSLTDSE